MEEFGGGEGDGEVGGWIRLGCYHGSLFLCLYYPVAVSVVQRGGCCIASEHFILVWVCLAGLAGWDLGWVGWFGALGRGYIGGWCGWVYFIHELYGEWYRDDLPRRELVALC